MLNRYILISIILLFFLKSNHVQASYDPTNTMIQAFCQDVGPFTKVALKQIDNIKNIIMQIKEDKECQNIYLATQSYLDELSIYHDDYFGSEKTSRSQRESTIFEDAIETEKIKLIAEHIEKYKKANPGATQTDIDLEESKYIPSSIILDALNDEYAHLKLEDISQKIRTGRFSSKNNRVSQLKVMKGLQHGLKGLYGSLNSSSQCRHDNNNLMSQLGATILGTAGNIYGGAVGAALVAGGMVLSGTQEVLRNIKYNSKIEDLENQKLQLAMGCSLEGISRNYCQARDVQKMIKFNLKDNVNNNECPDCGLIFDGIDLLARKIFVYNKWINKVLAGSVANNDAQAEERIKAFELFNNLIFSVEKMNGAINQTSTVIRQIPGGNTSDKELQLIQLTQRLAFQARQNVMICESRNNCVAGPYSNFFAKDGECGPYVWFYSKGTQRVANRRNESCDSYIRRAFPDTSWISIEKLIEISDILNEEAKEYVGIELQRVLEENPDRVMAEFTLIDPKFRSSPRDFFIHTKDYLEKLASILNARDHKYFLRLIEKTYRRITDAITIVDRNCEDEKNIYCDLAAKQITDIGILMAPKQQTFSLENALRTIVTQHLDILVEEGRIPYKFITHLMKYSNQNSPQFIINNYFKIHELQRDTSNAKVMTVGILRSLGELFLKRYYDFILKSSKEIEKFPWNEDLKTVVATRCFQFLHLPDDLGGFFSKKRKRKLLKLCGDTIYKSTNNKVPSLKFSQVRILNHDERICVLYDFKRKLNLLKLITPRVKTNMSFMP